MLDFFKKRKKSKPEELNPIPLPVISDDKKNPVAINEMLKNKTAIWGWYKVTDIRNNQINESALLNLTLGFEGLAVFRKENDYLMKYRVDVLGERHLIYLKLNKAWKFTPSNVMELFNTELSDAYKLFYDTDFEYTAECQSYIHDISYELLENELSNKRTYYVGEEHFFKKSDYPDVLPDEKEE